MDSTPLDREPVLAVCGWSGSGKTTLIEKAVPLLVQKGLHVAVVKHDAHGLQIDRKGKDSARLFAAGADVCLHSPEERVVRTRRRKEHDLTRVVLNLLATHDLVLVEGHKETPLRKIWCHKQGAEEVPKDISGVVVTLPWDSERVSTLISAVDDMLVSTIRGRALFAGVLIGGKSLRMGTPKHLVGIAGRSLLSRVEAVFRQKAERVVLLGHGEIPGDVGRLDQLVDAPGSGVGPLAGVITAFRWSPRTCWIVSACDMAGINVEAVDWLIEQRRPGCWGVVPRDPDGRLHPTLALYEPQAAELAEVLANRGCREPRALAEWQHVATPTIPGSLIPAWINVNTAGDLEAFKKRLLVTDS